MRKIKTAAAGAALVVAVLGSAPAAEATNIGYQGCTPGYWKNHTDSWTWGAGDSASVTPSTRFGDLFTSARANVADGTLLATLSGGGGSGANGAAVVLARAATAAWANAAHEGVGYPWRRWSAGEDGRPALVKTVNEAFASGDRATMLNLASALDADNNLGCPLN